MSDKPFFYDRDGQPIDVRRWAALFDDTDYRFLARTPVGPHTVITTWLGTNDEDDDPPSIFGTIVKTGESFHDEIRTPTGVGALLAHMELVNSMADRHSAAALTTMLEEIGDLPDDATIQDTPTYQRLLAQGDPTVAAIERRKR